MTWLGDRKAFLFPCALAFVLTLAAPASGQNETPPAPPALRPTAPAISPGQPQPGEPEAAQPPPATGQNAQEPQPQAPPIPEGHAEGEAAGTDTPLAITQSDYEPPEILTDVSALPFPVGTMRDLLIKAAQSGDVEKLRPYIGNGEDQTLLSFGGVSEDPIDFLRSASGDGEGYEILAILEEILAADFVHLDNGTDEEIYLWPYFHAIPLDSLTPQQRVELYKLVTHGDFEDMKAFGAYNFYRVGITPDGRWRFFVAGD